MKHPKCNLFSRRELGHIWKLVHPELTVLKTIANFPIISCVFNMTKLGKATPCYGGYILKNENKMTLRKIGFPIGTTNIQDVCFIFQKRNGKCENISASINSKLHIQILTWNSLCFFLFRLYLSIHSFISCRWRSSSFIAPHFLFVFSFNVQCNVN